jgi:hypothetical protein
LAEETLGWLFIDHVPLLLDKKKVARQLQIETWLDLAQVIKELGIEKLDTNKTPMSQTNYIV